MFVTPLFGMPTLTTVPPTEGVVNLAVSRSARARLASVISALAEFGVRQAAVEDPADLERVLSTARPAFALIAGDGDAAVAAALAADRLGVPIARIGAGLRCDDRGIEGEINRIVLDELAERLYVDGDPAVERLHAEGFEDDRVVRVGSTLADTPALRRRRRSVELGDVRLERGAYVLVTVHKPEHIGDDSRLRGIAKALCALTRRTRVVLCARADTHARLRALGLIGVLQAASVIVSGPAAHDDFIELLACAGAVVTDSAGVQEETTVLGVRCFTLGRSTARTLTLTHGSNVLLGDDPLEIAEVPLATLPEAVYPVPLWDGCAGRRIAADLVAWSGT
jgi:UDP-N-acetylglucosamine 2-epimerase (non-hydrolysing)